jgi:hypothetical protein
VSKSRPSPVPDAPDDGLGHVLETTGVTSSVGSEERGRLGHVLFEDYDDTPLSDVRDVAETLDGVTVILKSSERSYHLWNLSVRSLRRTATCKRYTSGDGRHETVGRKRHRWVLRVGPKVYADGSGVYKDAPTFEDAVIRPSRRPQSRGHLNVARRMAVSDDRLTAAQRLLTASGFYDLAGRGVRTETYATMTDPAKEWCHD